MPDENNHESLTHIYHRMLDHIRYSIESAEKDIAVALDHAFESARRNFTELGQATRDEAQLISDYIRRDTHDIALRMNQSREETRTWLHMDIELIEASLLDNLLQVADQTQIALAELSTNARTHSAYQTGEIAGPGVLICDTCARRIEFTQPDHIPICPDCSGTTFSRPPMEE